MEIGLRRKETNEYFPLARTRIRIGSDPNKNDIVLECESVAKEHAEIRVTNLGIEIDDLDSPRGTFVNEYKIDYHFLSNKDKLQIGTETFSLEFHQEKRARSNRCERCGVEIDERTTRRLSRSILGTGASRLLCERCEKKETQGKKSKSEHATSIFKKLQHLHSATRKFTKKGIQGLLDDTKET